MNFDDLIGLEESQARFLLLNNGYNNIETFINSKDDDNNYNKLIVCLVKYDGIVVTIICGRFNLI